MSMGSIAGSSRAPDAALMQFILRARLVVPGERPRFTTLTGGVSSDIWLVETGSRRFCVKRALAKLRVEADWNAPVERSIFEAAWLKGVGKIVPAAVPRILADDPDAGMLAMEFLPPDQFRSWKADLLAGHSDREVASTVGNRLGRIHSAFSKDPSAPGTFPRDDIFHAIRLEPYLAATGRAHPRQQQAIMVLIDRTASTKQTVVHGDVSPKNILIGPDGPVFLDAECAWYGDPAFDLAFCLNHLLLKCLATPAAAADHLASFDCLCDAYFAQVDWEDRAELEVRVASLLPALFLARIDGKSPVEYIVAERQKDAIRRVALPLLDHAPSRLAEVRQAWADDLAKHART